MKKSILFLLSMIVFTNLSVFAKFGFGDYFFKYDDLQCGCWADPFWLKRLNIKAEIRISDPDIYITFGGKTSHYRIQNIKKLPEDGFLFYLSDEMVYDDRAERFWFTKDEDRFEDENGLNFTFLTKDLYSIYEFEVTAIESDCNNKQELYSLWQKLCAIYGDPKP